MRSVLALTLALAMATPAVAAGKSEPKDDAPAIDMSPIALPVLLNGRVVNYVYVHLRLLTGPGADQNALRRKEPFIRDAVVRGAHRNALNNPDQLTSLDEPRLNALALAEARRVGGAKNFKAVVVTRQEAKRVRGLPNQKPST
jgi:hypothetical protein